MYAQRSRPSRIVLPVLVAISACRTLDVATIVKANNTASWDVGTTNNHGRAVK